MVITDDAVSLRTAAKYSNNLAKPDPFEYKDVGSTKTMQMRGSSED